MLILHCGRASCHEEDEGTQGDEERGSRERAPRTRGRGRTLARRGRKPPPSGGGAAGAGCRAAMSGAEADLAGAEADLAGSEADLAASEGACQRPTAPVGRHWGPR
jgi:hypothetical protein